MPPAAADQENWKKLENRLSNIEAVLTSNSTVLAEIVGLLTKEPSVEDAGPDPIEQLTQAIERLAEGVYQMKTEIVSAIERAAGNEPSDDENSEDAVHERRAPGKS
ncbi:MAG: hypothetical protein ING19_02860 [Azospirillum sp.]|nr:hypothetical protein [Azospirillum sp.]